MNRLLASLVIPALLSSAACSVEPGAESSSESVATTSEPLTVVDGFGVTWTKVGTPFDANYLASCGDNLVAQNQDGSIWLNGSNGADNAWVKQANRSTLSAGIGCAFASNVVTYNAGLYVMNSAAPKNLYRSYDWGKTWTFMDSPDYAQRIGSGGNRIWVVNTNKDLYYGNSTDNGPFQGWTYRGSGSFGGGVDRITGHQRGDYGPEYRAFTLHGDNSLYYNDKILTSTSSTNFHSFPNGGHNFDEIAASASDELYALTDDTNAQLWRAKITEEACFDGINNDNDYYSDSWDVDCRPEYAAKTCQTYGTGKWCIGRVTTASAAGVLVNCSGSTVLGTSSNYDCIETAANNGTDYLQDAPIK